MTFKLSVGIGCLVMCAPLAATPPTCITGTLASYMALGAQGCTFDGSTYANFTYGTKVSAGAVALKATQIMVTPSFQPTASERFGFSAPWSVAQGQTQDSVISYTIVLPCGDNQPAELDLTLGHVQISGIIGSVNVEQTTNVGSLSVQENCVEVCQSPKTVDSLRTNPVSVLLIREHIRLSGGTNGVSLSDFAAGVNRCIPCV